MAELMVAIAKSGKRIRAFSEQQCRKSATSVKSSCLHP